MIPFESRGRIEFVLKRLKEESNFIDSELRCEVKNYGEGVKSSYWYNMKLLSKAWIDFKISIVECFI